MPKKGGKAAGVDQVKEWRDDRVFEGARVLPNAAAVRATAAVEGGC